MLEKQGLQTKPKSLTLHEWFSGIKFELKLGLTNEIP